MQRNFRFIYSENRILLLIYNIRILLSLTSSTKLRVAQAYKTSAASLIFIRSDDFAMLCDNDRSKDRERRFFEPNDDNIYEWKYDMKFHITLKYTFVRISHIPSPFAVNQPKLSIWQLDHPLLHLKRWINP